jgi:hypothetical protein
MVKCTIKWIDKQGNPTPDNNGRTLEFGQSEWFPICACHARQLNAPGMHIWESKPLECAEA